MIQRSSREEERDTTELRMEHPSGVLYLVPYESVPILVAALLDLPPSRELTITEFADQAGVTRQTVSTYLDVLQ